MNRDYGYTATTASSCGYNTWEPLGYQPTTTASNYYSWRAVVNEAPPPKPPDDEGKELFTDEELSELLSD